MRFALAALLALAAPAGAKEIVFLRTLDNKPLEFKYRTGQTITPQVEAFKKTGANPYSGDPAAIEAVRKHYVKFCQSRHLEDGSGRIG